MQLIWVDLGSDDLTVFNLSYVAMCAPLIQVNAVAACGPAPGCRPPRPFRVIRVDLTRPQRLHTAERKFSE
jgi:hypothetical protein